MANKKSGYDRKRPVISFRVNADVLTVLRMAWKEKGITPQEFYETISWEYARRLHDGIPLDKIRIIAEPGEYQKTIVNETEYLKSRNEVRGQKDVYGIKSTQSEIRCPRCGSKDLAKYSFGYVCKNCLNVIVM
jgi:hypothetical protein